MTFTSFTTIIHAQVPVVDSTLVTVMVNNVGPAGTCTGLFVTVTPFITAVLLVCSQSHTCTACGQRDINRYLIPDKVINQNKILITLTPTVSVQSIAIVARLAL